MGISRLLAGKKAKAESIPHFGTVTSIDGSTYYVTVDGNTEPTPCTTSVRSRVGQRVVVEVNDGMALITGNVTSPPADGQAIDEIVTDVNGIETLIRETPDGVMVAKVNGDYGALVNADGSFDIIDIIWSDGQPSTWSQVATISRNIQEFHVQGTSGKFKIVTDDADSQPMFEYANGSFTAGKTSAHRISFNTSASTPLSIILGVLNPSTIFQVDSDGISGDAYKFSADADYIYLRVPSNDIVRISKSNGNYQFWTGSSWQTAFYRASTSRTKNTVLAAPNGSNGAATFRALEQADLPANPWTQIVASFTGDGSTAKSLTLTNYSEILVTAKYGSTYAATTVIPKAALDSSYQDWYLGGWYRTNTYASAAQISKTSIKPYKGYVAGAEQSLTWVVYARK